MCGIAGYVGGSSLSEEKRHATLNGIAHRGPDSHGSGNYVVANKKVWFGHTRLAIQDLSVAGNQPMASADGRYVICYNGEVYNHFDLRKELNLTFKGHSDTETIVEYAARFGIEKTLRNLNGMFAFALLDNYEKKLYIARDPFGVKPVYVTHNNGIFAFASEVRGLNSITNDSFSLDEAGLDLFLTLRYVPSPNTLWQGIERVKPGHFMTLDLKSMTVTTERYIEATSTQFSGSLVDAVNQYRENLRLAVKRQLLSDVPVGVLLSGGIDSALIAAMAKDEGCNIPAFCVGFGKEYEDCEIEDARETASVLGIPFTSIEVTPDDLLDAFTKVSDSVEEPLGTTSILPMWYLTHKAREDVTVVLTGQGNDEPWGGYKRYQLELYRKILPFAPLWKIFHSAGKLLPSMPDAMERGLRSLAEPDLTKRFIESYALFTEDERAKLIDIKPANMANRLVGEWVDWVKKSSAPPEEWMMRIDSHMNLADDLLLYGDKISMAVALEARVPMLDIELVKFVESLPLNYRAAIGKTKIVHKKMAEQYLPGSIVHRKKKGFQVPFTTWSRGIWKNWIEEVLFTENAHHLQFIKRKGLEDFWMKHRDGKVDKGRHIFSLLMLALWSKQQAELTK